MTPKGLVGPVWAMARPRRPVAETDALRAARAMLRGELTITAAAKELAQRVVNDAVAFVDQDTSDPMIAALADLALATGGPIAVLARCPEIDTAAEIMNRRADRFMARGCRQLSAGAWAAETRSIAAEVTDLLAARYARHLRK